MSPPAGFVPPAGAEEYHYGIVRPVSSTQHCLALESTNDQAYASQNSLVDSRCTNIDAKYTTFLGVTTDVGQLLYFANVNSAVVISGTAHGEIQLYTNVTETNNTGMQLLLMNPGPGTVY
jgi:hypothetical protein